MSYRKLIKEMHKDPNLTFKKKKGNVFMVLDNNSNERYLVHPGEAAYTPLRTWYKKIKKE